MQNFLRDPLPATPLHPLRVPGTTPRHPLQFNRDTKVACGNWFDAKFGSEDRPPERREPFFGRRDNTTDIPKPGDWEPFTSLKDKYSQILDVLTRKTFQLSIDDLRRTTVTIYDNLPFGGKGHLKPASAPAPTTTKKKAGTTTKKKAAAKKNPTKATTKPKAASSTSAPPKPPQSTRRTRRQLRSG
ncbi:MAG: hypothetical protein CMM25_01865 [Rhodospirillaceae bacterium]|nr:hypothetical protein [Rhodospirillaceae bacterium]